MAKQRSERQQTLLETKVVEYLKVQKDPKVIQYWLKRSHRLEASVQEIQAIIDNANNLELDL